MFKRLLTIAFACGLLLCGTTQAANLPNLTVTIQSKTATTVTYQWVSPVGAEGYQFKVNGKILSTSNNGALSSIKFAISNCTGKNSCVVHPFAGIADGVAPDPNAIVVVPPPPPPPPNTGCTVTVSSTTAAITAVGLGTPVVCLQAGTYGPIVLTGIHLTPVVLQPASGKVVTSGVTINGTNLTVTNLYSTGGITIMSGSNHISVTNNDVTNSIGGYGVSAFCNGVPQPGCSFLNVSGNRIHDLKSGADDGDAIRLDGWSNATVTGNEVTRVEQNQAPNSAHTDCLQSYNAGIGTHDITFSKNYVHDSQCQVFFLHDGDVSNVTVTDNLSVRTTNLGGSDTAVWLATSIPNAVVRNNTVLNSSSAIQGNSGSAAAVDHNIFDDFNNLGGYALTESFNIFTDGNQWSFTPNSTDQPTAYGIKVAPAYMCGSTCGNGTQAGDDYRLVSNPNHIGVDWKPSDYIYGPR